jgi:hypothetical protein
MDRRRMDRWIERHPASEPPDARETPWYQQVILIDELLARATKQWAAPTLREIQRTIARTERVTPRQRAAVQAIADATGALHDWAKLYPWPID